MEATQVAELQNRIELKDAPILLHWVFYCTTKVASLVVQSENESNGSQPIYNVFGKRKSCLHYSAGKFWASSGSFTENQRFFSTGQPARNQCPATGLLRK